MEIYNRNICSPPKSLVKEGVLQFGCYNKPIENINLLDIKKPYKLRLPRFLKNIQLREWQAFQFGNKDYFMMFAIYNAKKLSLAQFIFYDIKQNKKIKYEKKVSPWQLNVPDGLFKTTASYTSKNMSLNVFHDVANSKLELNVDIKDFGKLPNAKGSISGYHNVDTYEPIVVSLPFSDSRGMYSHKCLMPMKGNLKIEDKKYTFNKKDAYIIIDDHKGYYPHKTNYDWVTAAGYSKQGDFIGFNLTDNQVLHKDKFNENGLWINGKLNPLPPIKIEHPNGVEQDWIIKDNYDMVNLVFHPKTKSSVNVNLVFLKSKYQGPYGYFEGYIRNTLGEKIQIDNLLGMGEDFYLMA